jgi:hypothetical protein
MHRFRLCDVKAMPYQRCTLRQRMMRQPRSSDFAREYVLPLLS